MLFRDISSKKIIEIKKLDYLDDKIYMKNLIKLFTLEFKIEEEEDDDDDQDVILKILKK